MGRTKRYGAAWATLLTLLLTFACDDDESPAHDALLIVDAASLPEPTNDASNADGEIARSDAMNDPEPSAQWGRADLNCRPPNHPSIMPQTAREYADLCAEHGLGIPPTVSCDDAVRVPTMVDGDEVFESPESCDHTSMLKPSCDVGSKIARVQGQDADGNPLPKVVWIYFCRAAAETALSSVQMIGYHSETGATCYFEANESRNSILPDRLGRDEFNGLTGQMPGPDDVDFDRTFIPAPDQCVQCHQNNPFIRNPWLDGARLPENPDEPVLPTVGASSPYYVVGGSDWDMRTIHIEGNACLSCHRIGMEIEQIFANNGFDVNTYMPPGAPGSMQGDYNALLDCWENGPANTPGCEWIIPPAGECDGGIVGSDYPYASPQFNQPKGGAGDDDGGFNGSECADSVVIGDACMGDPISTACTRGADWIYCEEGIWVSK